MADAEKYEGGCKDLHAECGAIFFALPTSSDVMMTLRVRGCNVINKIMWHVLVYVAIQSSSKWSKCYLPSPGYQVI